MASFDVGARVVYPIHGAGIIEAVETAEVLGERREYYVLHLPIGDMTVMIPVDDVEASGLRGVVGASELEEVFELLRGEPTSMSSHWNHRYRDNTQKLKTGDIYELAEVVRNLTIRDREKGLALTERRMLSDALDILLSELILATGMDEQEGAELLDAVLEDGPQTGD